MHGLENGGKQPSNLKLNDGEKVRNGGEGARGGRPLARKFDNRVHHLLQPVDVSL